MLDGLQYTDEEGDESSWNLEGVANPWQVTVLSIESSLLENSLSLH